MLGFKLNRDFIAATLCIKKEERNNCCKGNCQLNKQLKEDDRNNAESAAQNLKLKNEVVLFYETATSPEALQTLQNKQIAHYIFPPSLVIPRAIFHPPLNA
jgi:hypothetical protein